MYNIFKPIIGSVWFFKLIFVFINYQQRIIFYSGKKNNKEKCFKRAKHKQILKKTLKHSPAVDNHTFINCTKI